MWTVQSQAAVLAILTDLSKQVPKKVPSKFQRKKEVKLIKLNAD